MPRTRACNLSDLCRPVIVRRLNEQSPRRRQLARITSMPRMTRIALNLGRFVVGARYRMPATRQIRVRDKSLLARRRWRSVRFVSAREIETRASLDAITDHLAQPPCSIFKSLRARIARYIDQAALRGCKSEIPTLSAPPGSSRDD